MSYNLAAPNDSNTPTTLKGFLNALSPIPDDMVIAVETTASDARTYKLVHADDEHDAYGVALEFLAACVDPASRYYNVSSCAFHEVVRAGLPRRTMFDIDYKEPVTLDRLNAHINLLQEAYTQAFKSYFEYACDIDFSKASFAVTVPLG